MLMTPEATEEHPCMSYMGICGPKVFVFLGGWPINCV